MSEGNDIVIGSRQIAGANRYGEPQSRHLLGRGFNKLVQMLAVRGFHDTQCGFKCFSAAAADVLFPLQRTTGWGFDVELLFLAKKHGMRVLEIPIDWRHDSDSRLNPASAGLNMLRDVLAVRWRSLLGRYSSSHTNNRLDGRYVRNRPYHSRRMLIKMGVLTGTAAIVVPTYNEAENLPLLAERIFSLGVPDMRIIVVDDNSPDGTADLAQCPR